MSRADPSRQSQGSSGQEGATVGEVRRSLIDGRYRILRPIGAGGMATVFEGEDTLLGRLIAVKILHERHAGDMSLVSRFETEAKALAALKHPGIVEVYDLGTDGDDRFIVMELVPGVPLKELVTNGPLSLDQTIDIGVQVAKALDSAHAAGVIHRDIKSQNIIVSEAGAAKLVDFGIAAADRFVGEPDEAVLGTVHYVAPERARGERATAATDIYSLGVVLYEMATGRVPFDGLTALEIATRHVNEPAPRPSSLNPQIPTHVEGAILHALEKQPSQRPASGGQLARELLALDAVHDQTTRIISPVPDVSGGRETSGRRPTVRVGRRGRGSTGTPADPPRSMWPLVALMLLALVLVLGLFPLWAAVLQPGRG